MEEKMEHYEEDEQWEEVPFAPEEEPPAERPQVTFMGNNYDLASLTAVISALLLMFLCLTCNMGYYCLPVFPLVLGIIGLVTAKSSVDAERTRLFSWIGVGAGGLTLLLLVLGVIAYVAFMAIIIMSGAGESW